MNISKKKQNKKQSTKAGTEYKTMKKIITKKK